MAGVGGEFQTSGILIFTHVQKLCGPKIQQFLSCMLQFLDDLWRHFCNYLDDSLTLDLLKGPILNAGSSKKFIFVDHPKKTLMNESLKLRLYVKSGPTEKYSTEYLRRLQLTRV